MTEGKGINIIHTLSTFTASTDTAQHPPVTGLSSNNYYQRCISEELIARGNMSFGQYLYLMVAWSYTQVHVYRFAILVKWGNAV